MFKKYSSFFCVKTTHQHTVMGYILIGFGIGSLMVVAINQMESKDKTLIRNEYLLWLGIGVLVSGIIVLFI